MLLAFAISTRRFRPVRAFSPVFHQISLQKSHLHSSEQPTTIWTEYENPNNMDDQVVSAISGDGGIKVTVGTVRNIVNDVMMMHTLNPTAADALGRLMTCAILLSNGMQLEQTIQLTLNSDGPLRGVMAISTGAGEVRGYVGSPQVGDMPLQEAVGKGALQVVKNHPNWTNPYNGITAIRHGDVDRDVGIYLAESEQKSCALAAGTTINGILCTSAGGYLIEQLPGATDEEIEKVSQNLKKLVELDGGDSLPTNLMLRGMTPLDIARIILEDLEMAPLQQITPKFGCDCTDDRLLRAIRLLPKEEIEDIILKQEELEARCQFCGKVYRMGPDQIKKRLEEATGDPSKDADM